MKLIDLAIILVIVLLPLTLVNLIDTNARIKGQNLENLYNNIIDAALVDASTSMTEIETEEKEEIDYGYSSIKDGKVNINIQYGIDTFLKTLYNEFDVEGNHLTEEVFKQYIPIISIISYDGIYIYSVEEYDNNKKISHILKPKQYYTAEIGDYIVAYTLGDNASIISKTGQRYNGNLSTGNFFPSLPANVDLNTIKLQKESVIINKISNLVSYAINKHNDYALRNGIVYKFEVPTINNTEWQNTIKNPGMLAFVQGISVGNKYLNHYAIGTSKITEGSKYYLTKGQGILGVNHGNLYHRDISCSWIDDNNKLINDKSIDGKSFARNRLEAARHGYSPCPICNP